MPTKAAIQQELRERERELSELRDRLERMSSVSPSPQMESGQAGEPEKAVKKFTLSSAELTLIGKFSGSASQSSFDEWVQKVEIVFSSNQLSEAEKARTIPLLLTGGAYSYYSTIPEDTRRDFPELIRSFKQRYGNDTEDRLWEAVCKLNQRKWNSKTETLEKYTEDIDRLISITHKSEREKMEAVMRGLPDDIQRQVMCHKPKSVEAIMEYVRLLKPNEASTTANMAVQSAVLTPQAAAEEQAGTQSIQQVIQETVAREIQLAVSAMTAVPQNQRQNSNNFQTRNNGYGGRRAGSFITDCGRCGKSHMSNACFAYGQSCRGCGRTGHFQSRCRLGRSGAQSGGGAAAAAGVSAQ